MVASSLSSQLAGDDHRSTGTSPRRGETDHDALIHAFGHEPCRDELFSWCAFMVMIGAPLWRARALANRVKQKFLFENATMPDLEPIYTNDNCRFAAPLLWSLSIFWRESELTDDWKTLLTKDLEADGIRILSHQFSDSQTSQFGISTLPDVAPAMIVQRVKGRLYHLIHKRKPKPFKGNFSIRSVGHAPREAVEAYVAGQLVHHKMADPNVQARLREYQISCPEVDLSQMQKTSHGVFWYNLHLVFVHRERWNEIRHTVLDRVRSMMLAVAKKKKYRLAKAGILTDHVHLVLGCPFDATPLEVTLGFLNNLAFANQMKPVYQFGAYVETVGEYTNKVF